MAGPHVKEVVVHVLSTLLGAAGRQEGGGQGDTGTTTIMTPLPSWEDEASPSRRARLLLLLKLRVSNVLTHGFWHACDAASGMWQSFGKLAA